MGLSKHNPARRREAWVLAGLLLFSLLMTLKYFPGVEWDSEYAGNIFQAIHPEAFPGDPAIGSERSILEKPFQLSSFYLLVKAMGEIWLDDRFTAFFYLGLVLATLVGVDRIIKLAGLTDVASRLAIQLVFMRDHQLFDNKVTFAHQPSLNATAIALCLIVWMFYASLTRKPLWVFLLLALLAASLSVKATAYPILTCLIVYALQGRRHERYAVGALFGIAVAVFLVGIFFIIPIPEDQQILIWDTLAGVEKEEGNPFYPYPSATVMLYLNALLLFLCSFAYWAPNPDNSTIRSLQRLIVVMVSVYLVFGIYFTFSPDALKVALVAPFSLTRFLRWPQTIAYLLILISLFHWMKSNETSRGIAFATLVIGALLIIGPGNYGQWVLLFSSSLGAVLVCRVIWIRTTALLNQEGGLIAACFRNLPTLFTQTLALTIGIAFAVTIWTRIPDWKTWAEIGVIGNSRAAKLFEVSRYFRANTPPDTVILPLDHNPRKPGKLYSPRALATRSGRTLPVPISYGNLFNPDEWDFDRRMEKHLRDVQMAFLMNRWTEATSLMKELTPPPDYVVIPMDAIRSREGFERYFSEQATMGDFIILKILGP